MAKNFISEQFSAMCRDLTNLSSLIKRLPPRYAKVAAIPPTGKGMENEPVNKIVVTEQTGREALELAAHSYRDRSSHQPRLFAEVCQAHRGGTLVLPFQDWCS